MRVRTRCLAPVVAVALAFGQQQPPPAKHHAPPGFGLTGPAPQPSQGSQKKHPGRRKILERPPEQPPAARQTQPAAQAEPAAPSAAKPQTEAAKPAQAPAAPGPVTLTPVPSGRFVLNLQNANLTEVIDILARRLKINYILDRKST